MLPHHRQVSRNNMQERIDDAMAFVGIIIGICVGAIYALFRTKNRGDINRKNVTQFGAGTLEQDIQSSIDQAKAMARDRTQAVD